MVGRPAAGRKHPLTAIRGTQRNLTASFVI